MTPINRPNPIGTRFGEAIQTINLKINFMAFLQINNRPAARSIDHLFNEFFSNQGSSLQSKTVTPETNILEASGHFQVQMLVPGRNKADFKITLEKSILQISYESKEPLQQQEQKNIRQEFVLGSFKRSFHVDESIDTENIQAKYENGILYLTLPKKQPQAESNRNISIL